VTIDEPGARHRRPQCRKRKGELAPKEFERLAERAMLEVLRCQEEAGLDLLTDGEHRRDNFYSFVAEKLAVVRMMRLTELHVYAKGEHGFGVREKGQPTDAGTEACVARLRGHGMLKPGRR
jgi:hypothetical protein